MGVKPEASSLHIFNGVGQWRAGGLRQKQGEGRAQQRAQSTHHHGSLWTDAPQEVHHGSQDSSSPGTHGADTDPILSARNAITQVNSPAAVSTSNGSAIIGSVCVTFIYHYRQQNSHTHLMTVGNTSAE